MTIEDTTATEPTIGTIFNLVSVVMPSFNAEKFIGSAIESVIAQTYQQWELIIVDDCSTDRTREIVAAFQLKDERVRLLRNKGNLGAAGTRNRALRVAKGQYVAFLDADDLWLPDKLKQQLQFMCEAAEIFTFTAYRIMDESGSLRAQVVDLRCPDAVSYRDMLNKRATLGCSTVVIDQSRTGRLEMPDIRTGQDYALWLKLLGSGASARRLAVPLTHYRICSNSISRNKLKKARRQWRIYREIERINLPRSAWHFANYAWRAVVRA